MIIKRYKILFLFFITFIYSREIKIATYNVDNLFDLQNNHTEYNDYTPFKKNWNKTNLEIKLENISRVLCEIDADIVGLEEVENKNALNLLLKKLKSKGCNYTYSAITNKKKSAIEVALISKIAIKQKRDIIVSKKARDRNILEVVLKTDPKLTIFVNHWRSKAAKESQRVKYAKALIKRINKLPKNREYIILGDFNSNYNECSHLKRKFNDTNNSCGIDTILKTFKKNNLITLNEKISKPYHYNLWSELKPYQRWSYDWYGKRGAIDSIIISANLNDNKNWEYKRGSFRVFKKKFLFKKGYIYRWRYSKKDHLGKGYSDHLPLIATFINKSNNSIFDKILKLIIPNKKNNKSQKRVKQKTINIKQLKNNKYLKGNFILKNVCVVFKREDDGVISDLKGNDIFIYKAAYPLKEGYCYDLIIYEKKEYSKLNEITDLKVIKQLNKFNQNKYIDSFDISLLKDKNIGKVVKNIIGVYKNGFLYLNKAKIKLYLKEKRKGLLKKSKKLFIKKALIGYYKKSKELIVYSLDDIKELK